MCIHSWIIDQHNFGRCKYCPATQQFPFSEVTLTDQERNKVEAGYCAIGVPDSPPTYTLRLESNRIFEPLY